MLSPRLSEGAQHAACSLPGGRCLIRLDRPTEAIPELRLEQQITPDDPDVEYQLAYALSCRHRRRVKRSRYCGKSSLKGRSCPGAVRTRKGFAGTRRRCGSRDALGVSRALRQFEGLHPLPASVGLSPRGPHSGCGSRTSCLSDYQSAASRSSGFSPLISVSMKFTRTKIRINALSLSNDLCAIVISP